ncbi:hypothetical protein AGABI1DRAFT_94622 [Agaricus bisporus var. burnettii JB137-S8]|uniref:Uncharacterized protein n=1 Tax=Agaricus bisporus var. burnettii (strain JB137-S8 / ATCC MYA-4627 / FGSC 10392) TaxID=597362 RepID=K5WYD9_AGABU|nr:uncharacterized protein AGABI1DRAFT_94622 [Agaricus bisporus var. burnettii JB137-S8]EKM75848.1 hypothetical protein AGABI1DRAFT_94622 [Agaricus bisporus var. burnettii JB137-S8]
MSSPSSVHDNQSPNQCPGQSSQPSALDSKGKSVESVVINPASSQIRPVRTTSTENPTIDTSFSDFEEELDESATSLGTSVFVSATVGATILAAFLSLAEDVTRKRGQDFEIAMFFCFLAGTCYVSNVLVCGRTLILAFKHKPSRRSSTDRKEHSKRMEAVFRVQQLCLWIQGLGQTLFGIAILYTLWQVIQNRILISVIYGFTSMLQVVVYGVGFWRISWMESMILPTSKWFLRLRRHRREYGEDAQH